MSSVPIVFIPDACDVSGKLVSLVQRSTAKSLNQAHLMVDVGISAAQHGLSFVEYVKLVDRAVSSASWQSVRIVVPDAFGNHKLTVERWRKFAPTLRRYGELMFVAQQLQPPPEDLDPRPDIVAVPARRLGDIDCAREHMRCAQYIARFIVDYHSSFRIHLLGPAARTLRRLRRWGTLRYVESFDTAAYRHAPTYRLKRDNGGKRYAGTTDTACTWFRTWMSLVFDRY
jgi:hypothetical protein